MNLLVQDGTEFPAAAAGMEPAQTNAYVAVIERDADGCSGYVPDLPGLGVAGKTEAEVRTLLAEAVPFHIEGLREDGVPIPQPSATIHWVEPDGGT